MSRCLLCMLFAFLQVQEDHFVDGLKLPLPQGLNVASNKRNHMLYVAFECDSTEDGVDFEIEVLGAQEEVLHHDIITGQSSRFQCWNWISPLVQQCTACKVRVRSKLKDHTSPWISSQKMKGNTEEVLLSTSNVVAVGSSMGFCFVAPEGERPFYCQYNMETIKNITQINPCTFSFIVSHQPPSPYEGHNVYCEFSNDYMATVVYVGYPPDDSRLECQTDLESVSCHWNTGRNTHLVGPRKTIYTLDGRPCQTSGLCKLSGPIMWGERNWTLISQNPLGKVELTDKVDLRQRVLLRKPQEVQEVVRHARNSTISWVWGLEQYKTVELVCKVKRSHGNQTTEQEYVGLGLSRLDLTNLLPDTTYSVEVCCGTRHNFWKWTCWKMTDFTTTQDRPDALDIWIQRKSIETALIMWKHPTRSQSHGQIKQYDVKWESAVAGQKQDPSKPHASLGGPHNLNVSHLQHSAVLDLGQGGQNQPFIVTVTAWNNAGSSPPARVIVPKLLRDVPDASRVYASGSKITLSWPTYASATCGYIVDWCPDHDDEDVKWKKVSTGETKVSIQTASFRAGVRYNFSVHVCTAGAPPELFRRMEGYPNERAPAQQVKGLKAIQEGAKVVVTWEAVPEESRGGFIQGYIIRCSSSVVPEVNVSDPDRLKHTFEAVPPGSYTFTVTAYTLGGGENKGHSIDIVVQPSEDMVLMIVVLSMLVFSGLLLFLIAVCYRHRAWIKRIVYPEVPKPKFSREWIRKETTRPWTLDMKPCLHNQLTITEKCKELENIKLDSEEEESHFPTDTDCSTFLVQSYMQELTMKPDSPFPAAPSSSLNQNYCALEHPQPRESLSINSTYTAILPQSSKDQMGLTPNLAWPLTTLGSYVPQDVSEEEVPRNDSSDEHLISPISISSLEFLLPSYVSGETSEDHLPCFSSSTSSHIISNPTYCTTFPGPSHTALL